MTHILSMNIRGVGDAPKSNCLRNLLDDSSINIFLAQETLCCREKAIDTFLGYKSGWCAVATDSNGHSGGLIAIWNPAMATFKAYRFFGGILLLGQLRGMEGHINIANMYAPYKDKQNFWNQMENSGIFMLQNLILMGNLNFTLQSDEIWGENGRMDPLSSSLLDLFAAHQMSDIRPCPLMPTWSNKITGYQYIGKRLDRDIMKDNLIDSWDT